MATPKHLLALQLRSFAEKVAADANAQQKSAAGEGAPDSMTTADGQGGITQSKGTVPSDIGESELKRDQPTDGVNRPAAAIPTGSPDSMTTADGQGGITQSKGTVPTDVGEAEIKRDQPADGEARKAATITGAAARIRAAVNQARGEAPAAAPAAPVAQSKSAGAEPAAADALELSEASLAKIAREILSTEEGAHFTYRLFEKSAGDAAARQLIQEAIQAATVYDQSEQIKFASEQIVHATAADLQEKVASIHDALIASGITDEDAEAIIKTAAFHQEQLSAFEHPMLKAAYAQGMDDAALMAAAEEAGGEEGAPAPEEALPMGGEQLSEEEILQLLQEMLASGDITKEEIEAALGGEAGGEAAAVAPEEVAPEAAVV